uniref:DNA-directed RNA polymerase I subunit RPA12 n=1 Tax=Timema poppense TaxID=170557 RepID=A0A7R9DK76_TIMPO|nr:unnamed protein product [Timema poppensis]
MPHLTVVVFGEMRTHYVINFNSSSQVKSKKRHSRGKQEEPEGPVVERRCQHCNNDKMSYATLQLRSADEGQTVFYTCTKCKRTCFSSKAVVSVGPVPNLRLPLYNPGFKILDCWFQDTRLLVQGNGELLNSRTWHEGASVTPTPEFFTA